MNRWWHSVRYSRSRTGFLVYGCFAVAMFLGSGFFTPDLLLGQESVKAADELALRQGDLADRYSRLEKLILRMAEFDAADNPRRSELLKKAFTMSKDRRVQMQMEKLVDFLEQGRLSKAVSESGCRDFEISSRCWNCC